MRGVLMDLVELVFPADCPGCGAPGEAAPLCARCAATLAAAPARPTAPDPPPPGLPPCWALGPYQGLLRELILSYKERGRLGLAAPLGRALATGVRALVPPTAAARADPPRAVPPVPVSGAGPASGPVSGVVTGAVLLVPVPATGAAARARHGDHMLRLARSAARALRRYGVAAPVWRPLAARPRAADSTELTAADRIARADRAFRLRSGAVAPIRAGPVVLLDDLVTTGATLAGAARLLRSAGVPVTAAVTLAATRRRGPPVAHSTW